jgi:hypothetical protein
MTTNKASRVQVYNGEIALQVAPSGTAGTVVPWINALRATVDGNIGIGTTSPSHRLDLHSSSQWVARFKKTDATNGGIIIEAATGYNPNLALAVNGTKKWFMNSNSSSSDSLQFWETTGTIPRFTLTQAGNAGIGTSNPGVGYRLDVQRGKINSSDGLCIAGDCKTAWSQVTGTSPWITSGSDVHYNTGNVGIGTTGPLSRLHVAKAATLGDVSTANQLMVGVDNTADYNLAVGYYNVGSWYAGVLQANNAGSGTSLLLNPSSGNVGIGTAIPGKALEVNSASGNNLRLTYNDSNGSAANNTDFATSSSGDLTVTPSGGDISFAGTGNFSNHLGINRTSFNNCLFVNNSGNVGVGMSTPNYKLDAGGQINATGGLCIAGDCKSAWSQIGGSQWTTAGSDIHYGTGKVGIGTASPGRKLVIQSDTANDHLSIVRPTTNAATLNIGIDNTGPFFESTTINKPISFYTHNGTSIAERVRIDKDGNLGVGTYAPTSKLHVVGSGHVTQNLTVDGIINAKYQDVAEWVPSTQALPAGTVVTLDPTKSNHVEASSKAYDTRVAGVVSAQPGIALGEQGENKVLVATTGRVKVMVDASAGPIGVGDLLVTSDTEGVAMKSEPVEVGKRHMHMPGTLIGKALEPLEKGRRQILVLLSLQ